MTDATGAAPFPDSSDTANPPATLPPGNGYAPISMVYLFFSTLLFSYVYGGLMLCLNWKRLGKPERFTWSLVLWLVFVVVLSFATAFISFVLNLHWLFALLLPGAIAGLVYVLWQRRAYNEWMASYGSQRKQLRKYGPLTAIALIFASLFVVAVVYYAVATVINAPLTTLAYSLRPPVAFEGDGVTLTYPGAWTALSDEEAGDICQIQGATCVLNLIHASGVAGLQVFRVDDQSLNLDAEVNRVAMEQEHARQGGSVLSENTLTIAGEQAYDVVVQHSSGQVWQEVFLNEPSGSLLYVQAIYADSAAYEQHRAEVDAFLNSLALKS
jgi:hypothetical protein